MIHVEIWSDLICPWCWIGRRRFENSLARSPHKDRFAVVHRAFRLGPAAKVAPVEQMLAHRYGKSPEDVERMLKHVESTAAKDGLEYHLAGTYFGDTTEAHRLILWSQRSGRQHDVLERFSKAYFTDKENVFDRSVLIRLMTEVGFAGKEVDTFLSGTDFISTIEEHEDQARAYGSTGVPFFVFANKYGVSGAQPVKTFEQVIADILKEEGLT